MKFVHTNKNLPEVFVYNRTFIWINIQDEHKPHRWCNG